MADDRFSIGDLAELVKQRRGSLGLRQAAEQVGISFNTLSRVERGHQPDMATFLRIVEWLGVDPARFFGPNEVRLDPTPDVVAQHLRHDPALSDAAAQQIAEIVRTMYTSLAKPPLGLALHLRAAPTFKPEAADLLADILQEMQAKVDAL